MGQKTKVAIIILNYNGEKDTIECLESLRKITKKTIDASVIVVDNGSSDGSVGKIRKNFPKISIIENKKNLGFSEGNNVGVKKALKDDNDYVFILNNDTIVAPSLIEELVKASQKTKNEIVSPKIYFAPGYEFHKTRYQKKERGRVIWYAGGMIDWRNVLTSHRGVDSVDIGQFDKETKSEFATGCAMLVKREVFKKIGFFDPVYFAYFEDADFSQRAKKNGFKILFAPKARMWHKNASSFGGSGSKFQDYFVTRNRIIFALRYAPIRAKIAVLRESILSIIKGPASKRIAIFDALTRNIAEIDALTT